MALENLSYLICLIFESFLLGTGLIINILGKALMYLLAMRMLLVLPAVLLMVKGNNPCIRRLRAVLASILVLNQYD